MHSSIDRDSKSARVSTAACVRTPGGFLLAILCVVASTRVVADNPLPSAQPGRYVVGIAPPAAQIEHADELTGPLQHYIEQALRGVATSSIALRSGTPAEAQAEAKAQGCDYFVLTHIEQKHSGGGGASGFFSKIAPFASALPGLGALGGRGGGSGAVISQAAASVTQSVAQQQMAGQTGQMGGSPSSGIKAGDTVTVEYRLVSATDGRVMHSDHVQSKAKNDSEDVVGPLLTQVAADVVGTLVGAPAAATSAPDRGAPGVTSPQPPAPGAESKHGGVFGGLFGGGHKDPPPSQNATPQSVDCDSIARMPGATMTPEFCRQMSGAQGAYQAAQNDPRASRPGDESIGCAQIAAEIQQQQYTAPDQAKVAQGQAVAGDLQRKLAVQQAQITAVAAKEQAEVNTAIAADTAVEHATMGVVNPRTTLAVEMKQQAENRALGDKLAKDRAPQEQALYASTGGFAQDATAQIASNPRLARLIQMASDKHCKM